MKIDLLTLKVQIGQNFNLLSFLIILFINISFITINYNLISLSIKNKDIKTKISYLLVINSLIFSFYYFYKIIYYLYYNGSIIDLIPLHLCNINIILYFISIKYKNKTLLGFSFYTIIIGASLAILFPDNFIDGLSFFHPLSLGYYFFHSLLVVMALLSLKLDFFKPSFKTGNETFILILKINVLIFFINLIFNNIMKIKSNYFFHMDASSVSQLNYFYKILPVQFLYIIPLILISLPLMYLIGFIFDYTNKYKNNKRLTKK